MHSRSILLLGAEIILALTALAAAVPARPQGDVPQQAAAPPAAPDDQQIQADADRCEKDPNPDVAIASCTRAIASGHFADANESVLFYDRGLNYQGKQAYDLAIKDYDEAIGLNPNFAEAFYNRGMTYYRKEDGEHALADLNQAIALKADFGAAFRSRGDVYESEGDNDRAIQDYEQAIKLNPNDADAWNDRGASYLSKGYSEDDAIKDLNRAIELNPTFAVAFTNRGSAYSYKGQDVRAIEDFSEAIRLDPNLALAFNNRGVSHSNLGEYDLALQDFDQAARINPAAPEPFYNRGRARFERGLFTPAAADFTAAAARDPDGLYFQIWTYMARARAGQKPDAVLPSEQRPDLSEWPGPVVSLYQGGMDSAALFAAADDSDPQIKRTRLCEARFYLGEYELIRGERQKAQADLRAAMSICPIGFDEYVGARAELARMLAK